MTILVLNLTIVMVGGSESDRKSTALRSSMSCCSSMGAVLVDLAQLSLTTTNMHLYEQTS